MNGVKKVINTIKKKPFLLVPIIGFCAFALYLGSKKDTKEESQDIIESYENDSYQKTYDTSYSGTSGTSTRTNDTQDYATQSDVQNLYDFIDTSNVQIAETFADTHEKINERNEEIVSAINNNTNAISTNTSNYEDLSEKVNAIQSSVNNMQVYNQQQQVKLNMDDVAKKMTSSLINKRTPLIQTTTTKQDLPLYVEKSKTTANKNSSSAAKASAAKASAAKTSIAKATAVKASAKTSTTKTSTAKKSTKKKTK